VQVVSRVFGQPDGQPQREACLNELLAPPAGELLFVSLPSGRYLHTY
jgi:hypothetical protein